MATNVTAHDVRVTRRNALPLMQYLLYKSTPVVKENVPVCIETEAHSFVLAQPAILRSCDLRNMMFH